MLTLHDLTQNLCSAVWRAVYTKIPAPLKCSPVLVFRAPTLPRTAAAARTHRCCSSPSPSRASQLPPTSWRISQQPLSSLVLLVRLPPPSAPSPPFAARVLPSLISVRPRLLLHRGRFQPGGVEGLPRRPGRLCGGCDAGDAVHVAAHDDERAVLQRGGPGAGSSGGGGKRCAECAAAQQHSSTAHGASRLASPSHPRDSLCTAALSLPRAARYTVQALGGGRHSAPLPGLLHRRRRGAPVRE